MPNGAGQRPALGVPSPSTTKKDKAPDWPAATVSHIAFRFHALGGSERAAKLLLNHLAATGVRRVDRYVAGISDDDLTAYLTKADNAAAAAETATGIGGRRGDLMTVRTPAQWPWRTNSGQMFGGVAHG